MGSEPRRLRAYLTAGLGALVALAVGGGGMFVLCDPGPRYWATLAAILGATAAICAWAAVTTRPRRLGLWLAPALMGGFLVLLGSVAVLNAVSPRGAASPALTESCREETSIGPAASARPALSARGTSRE